jgi:hypothetical protein
MLEETPSHYSFGALNTVPDRTLSGALGGRPKVRKEKRLSRSVVILFSRVIWITEQSLVSP